MRWDRRNSVRYIPLQDDRAQAVSGRSHGELEQAAHLVCPDRTVLAGAAAVRELFAYLPGGWIPRAVLGTPGAMRLAAKTYFWLARVYGPVT
jgi:predicted DCC family thiol-disulfide oxidoreductase YuxK